MAFAVGLLVGNVGWTESISPNQAVHFPLLKSDTENLKFVSPGMSGLLKEENTGKEMHQTSWMRSLVQQNV